MLTSRSRLIGWVTFIKAAAKMLVLARLLQGREAIIAAARLARSACQGGTHGMACQVPGTPDASAPLPGVRANGALWVPGFAEPPTTSALLPTNPDRPNPPRAPCPYIVYVRRDLFSFFLSFSIFQVLPLQFSRWPFLGDMVEEAGSGTICGLVAGNLAMGKCPQSTIICT